MGKKKVLVVIVFVLMLLIGWVLALKAVTHVDEIKKQDKLVAEADAFMKRGLYLRAIPLYEEAAKIKTTDKWAGVIEERLLNAYYLHEDYSDYTELVEKRAKRNVASVEEYKNAFNIYVEKHRMGGAFELIHKGIDNTNDEDLIQLYEDYRYIYKVRSTKFTHIEPTFDNSIMPAFDGEKWGYITSTGEVIIPAMYDYATAFSEEGIAAVSLNGKVYAINTVGDWYSVDDNPDTSRIQDVIYAFGHLFQAKRDGKYGFYNYDFKRVSDKYLFDEVTRASNGVIVGKNGSEWMIMSTDDASVVMDNIEDVAINSYGSVFRENRGFVKKDGAWKLINTKGEVLSSDKYNDVKAPESEGYMAVQNESEKWGFINDQGELVIDYQFDDAYSFSDDVAAVKHYSGYWFYIDKKGNPISEDKFEDAKPFHGGVGQVYDSGTAELIMFRYYEE